MRHLAWFSVDNDDTRDLDPLSVAGPLAAGAARLLVRSGRNDEQAREELLGTLAGWMKKRPFCSGILKQANSCRRHAPVAPRPRRCLKNNGSPAC
ncbi:hypothetical protein [Polaromonas sp.]|uniref:hypothetical protein n=1 Tax=Polaromonas sp. TaxID=1869339 RepID=UPI003263D3AA